MHESERGHEMVKNGQEASVHKTHVIFTPSGIHGTWAKYGNCAPITPASLRRWQVALGLLMDTGRVSKLLETVSLTQLEKTYDQPRQHVNKETLASKGLSSHGCGFPSGHVGM